MKRIFYRFLIAMSGRYGRWIFGFFAWWIATAYFLFFPERRATSIRFYRIAFPAKGRFHPIWCTWKQFHSFTRVFLDRHDVTGERNKTSSHEGWEYLETALKSGTGGVLVMSHVGNWELASKMILERDRKDRIKLLLYLGEKNKEQIERAQKESLVRSGIQIIVAEQGGGSPTDLLEGIKFLRAGGLVSMTGDRLWRKDQRSVSVSFFGHKADIPETPFVFSFLSGAPLLIFFACRTGERTYHFKVLPPMYVQAKDRKDRDTGIQKAAQLYANALEETVRQYPFEWFHFEPFIK